MADISLGELARSEFQRAQEQVNLAANAGYPMEWAVRTYLLPVQAKWKALESNAVSATGLVSPENIRASSDAANKAIQNYQTWVRGGYEPDEEAATRWLSPAISGIQAAGFAGKVEEASKRMNEPELRPGPNGSVWQVGRDGSAKQIVAPAEEEVSVSGVEFTGIPGKEAVPPQPAIKRGWPGFDWLIPDKPAVPGTPAETGIPGHRVSRRVPLSEYKAWISGGPNPFGFSESPALAPSGPVLTNAVPRVRILGIRQVQ